MNNLKTKLFEFRKTLGEDQADVAYIIDAHIRAAGQITEDGTIGILSESETIASLKEKLRPVLYFENVKELYEGLDSMGEQDPALAELKDIYWAMERADGLLYRQPLNVLFEIINTQDLNARNYKIINELSIYDWVPQIKNFMWKFKTSPEDRANMSSNGGMAADVFSIYIKTNEGGLTFIADKWFKVNENGVTGVLLEDYIKEDAELRSYRLLEEAVRVATITENRIDFRLDEGFTFGISTADGKIYLNESEVEANTTLDTLFSSGVIPFLHRGHYAVIGEAVKNVKKFAAIDIVKKISNVLNPYVECFAFNFKDCVALYRTDKRYGNSFYTYESASKLVKDVKDELDYDLTFFFEDKVNKDLVDAKKRTEKEIKIKEKLQQVDDSLFQLTINAELLKESADMRALETKLLAQRHILLEALNKKD